MKPLLETLACLAIGAVISALVVGAALWFSNPSLSNSLP